MAETPGNKGQAGGQEVQINPQTSSKQGRSEPQAQAPIQPQVTNQGQPQAMMQPMIMSGQMMMMPMMSGQQMMMQGQPVMTQGQPMMTQGQPMMTQGQPMMTQGLPMMTQGQPMMTQGQPMMTQGQPMMTQGQPMMTQGQPMMTQGQPVMLQTVMAIPAQLFTPVYNPVPGVPEGLEALHFSPGIAVHQELNALEMVLSTEMNNRYSIHNTLGQRIFYAAESTDCCTRQICKENREFIVWVYDSKGKKILEIERNCGCTLCFWGGGVGGSVVTVKMANNGELLGTLVQDCDCCSPRYHIEDAEEMTLCNIEGSSCTACCSSYSSVIFVVTDPSTGEPITSIQRKIKLINLFTDSQDSFGMNFTKNMDVKLKAVLLGAVICIDFNFFEGGKDGGLRYTGFNCLTVWGFLILFAVVGYFIIAAKKENET